METETFLHVTFLFKILFNNIDIVGIGGLILVIILLLSSALISGSEVAFFSLTPSNIEEIKMEQTSNANYLLLLLKKPEHLLATILITNNFVNIGIIIITTYITDTLIEFNNAPSWVSFLFKVVFVTFLLLLFGEIIPKVYASQFAKKFSLFMSLPITTLDRFLKPATFLLVNSTYIVKKRLSKQKPAISLDDLSEALDLTKNTVSENKKILEGIISYGSIDASEIMKSRVDVIAFDINQNFSDIFDKIKKYNYSRIPVYNETFDNIKGILFIKDLLPFIHKPAFNWQSLIRPAYFVPESKKINDLLLDFQVKKIHMAFVIDEYGGTSGIVTLEDILEEIVGEIMEESDKVDIHYKKIDNNNYIFEGKTLLNDFFKILDLEDDFFDIIKGDADTLAGIILEIKGEIPKAGIAVNYKNFIFKIVSSDERRIKQIKVTFIKNE